MSTSPVFAKPSRYPQDTLHASTAYGLGVPGMYETNGVVFLTKGRSFSFVILQSLLFLAHILPSITGMIHESLSDVHFTTYTNSRYPIHSTDLHTVLQPSWKAVSILAGTGIVVCPMFGSIFY